MNFFRTKRAGLTMIELLVILAILVFLLGLLVPAVQKVREAASRTQSSNNLKQLGLAMHNTNDVYKRLPPIVGSFPVPNQPNQQGTLFFYMLPFIEQDNIYKQADGSVWKNSTYSKVVGVFLNPQDKTAPPGNLFQGWLATSSYAGNWMVYKDGGAAIPRTFRDGTSSTIAFAERNQVCKGQPCGWGYASWYYWAPMFAYYSKAKFQLAPSPQDCDPALAQGANPSGIQVGMADASVRFLSDRLSSYTWYLACDPADGQILPADFENN